ncbi:phage major tail protein, TP901-1 family [Rhodoplanes roseus]|uniref:phage major tail protein, TP901-1 family n=1 Tax=Rhodoplanes roseus TaxID=29409 RepID=UPI001AECB87F|nr:phage major tail protein, TP901-1 family [Rhodoplanes roseus]
MTPLQRSGVWTTTGSRIKKASGAGRSDASDTVGRTADVDATLRQIVFDGAVRTYQLVIPDFGTVTGSFQITSLEFAGEHNGEVTFELALESAGALIFAGM